MQRNDISSSVEAIEQSEQKHVAHVNVIPMLSNGPEQKRNGTHRILVILKPPDLANPGRFNGDPLWFKGYRYPEGGRLNSSIYPFGLSEKEPPSYKSYNFYHLTRDFLAQKMSWSSSSTSSVPITRNVGYKPKDFEGLVAVPDHIKIWYPFTRTNKTVVHNEITSLQ